MSTFSAIVYIIAIICLIAAMIMPVLFIYHCYEDEWYKPKEERTFWPFYLAFYLYCFFIPFIWTCIVAGLKNDDEVYKLLDVRRWNVSLTIIGGLFCIIALTCQLMGEFFTAVGISGPYIMSMPAFIVEFVKQQKTQKNKHNTINKKGMNILLKMKPWYYATELNLKNETYKMLLPTGPIDYITLNNLFLNGILSPKTLVWNTELEDWAEACSLDIFQFTSNTTNKTNTNDSYLLKTLWYYATELNFKNETYRMLLPTGPIDYITLNNLFLNGTLSPKTLVWNTDLEDWTEACLLDIFQFVSNTTKTNDIHSSSPPNQE